MPKKRTSTRQAVNKGRRCKSNYRWILQCRPPLSHWLAGAQLAIAVWRNFILPQPLVTAFFFRFSPQRTNPQFTGALVRKYIALLTYNARNQHCSNKSGTKKGSPESRAKPERPGKKEENANRGRHSSKYIEAEFNFSPATEEHPKVTALTITRSSTFREASIDYSIRNVSSRRFRDATHAVRCVDDNIRSTVRF